MSAFLATLLFGLAAATEQVAASAIAKRLGCASLDTASLR
jgi:hypothetical protein